MSGFTLAAGAEAFGDGSHPSTKGALAALDILKDFRGFERALDIGCGSGILALQAATLWHIPVMACDIKAEAVAATQENARRNGLEALITARRSDGLSHPDIAAQAPYDLILCNILGYKLAELAGDVHAHLGEEGFVILAGMLAWEADRVMEAYRATGLILLQKFTISDWITLLFQKQ